MKGKLYFYRDVYSRMSERKPLTTDIIAMLKKDFKRKMGYPAEEIVARRGEVTKQAKALVTLVDHGIPPGHVILYPVIVREARKFYGKRRPV